MARVLILHASVGSGHKRAAEALAAAFARRMPGQVRVEDVLDYTNPLFREAYAHSYLRLTDKLPGLWGYVYEQTDRDLFRFTTEIRALVDAIWTRGLRRLLRSYQPNVVVCTHFLPVEVLSRHKSRAHLRQPLYCVLTDYSAHAFWAYRDVDRYFVATEETRRELVERGVPAGAIQVTGIPVHPDVTEPKERAACRRQLGYDAETPLIVLFGGGLDPNRVRVIISGLLQRQFAATLVVVAGRNRGLLQELHDLTGNERLRLVKLGFIDYVDDLVVAADLVITKAGGLTVSEVLARGRPMIIIDPIPGQEESNADYLVSVGAAAGIRLPQHVPFAITQLLSDAERLATMSHDATRAARPRAALEIVETILSDIGERRV
ncbi:MGDG synthase family glycosyltransferase [Kallotenue papyrolyticum]|uniref:MGDG synthase family glycosyltransferase n=1 Tax=Kallotenue papyrolyticum TaxID=1325125 RepID=UPI00047865F2|nr:glycosyltransferase [Kallotenue papyrolyticum]